VCQTSHSFCCLLLLFVPNIYAPNPQQISQYIWRFGASFHKVPSTPLPPHLPPPSPLPTLRFESSECHIFRSDPLIGYCPLLLK
jgi:hypothetical protein